MHSRWKLLLAIVGFAVWCAGARKLVADDVGDKTGSAVAGCVVLDARVPEAVQPKVKPAFLPLPAGAVEPLGWLRDWAVAARDGITGHLDEGYPVFRDSWKGIPVDGPGVFASADGAGLPLEQCAYWLDSLLRLGYLLHDEAVIEKATQRLELVVEGVNSGGTSFIYWKEGKPQGVFNSWSHSHMGRALVAWYQATGDKRILQALVKAYCDYPTPLGHLEFQADISGLCNIDAMLETYRLSGDRRVLERAQAAMEAPDVQATVRDWAEGKFITGHGVCAYEQIRLPILYYQWSGEAKYRQASCNAFDNFTKEHMLPYGVTSSEEWLSGVGAFRLTETCDVAVHLWSAAWMYRILGERTYGDSVERAFFNAAPAPIARDFKTVCYLQSPNRIQPKCLPIGWNPGCLEFCPMFYPPCCHGNVNRIIPTYVTHMWMATADHGLAATLYGPCRVTALAGEKTRVRLTCETAYPFEETIRIGVEPEQDAAFPLYFRMPAWCSHPKISVNGAPVEAAQDKNGFVRIERTWTKGDSVALTFPMSVQVDRGFETEYPASSKVYFASRPSAVYEKRRLPYETISYGPLLFSLPIPDIDANTPAADAKWQYALDNQAELNGGDIEVQRQPMPPTWAWPLDAPIALKVPAKTFDWHPTEAQALPNAPVTGDASATLRLVPYGCTKFRISMFPVTDKAWKGKKAEE